MFGAIISAAASHLNKAFDWWSAGERADDAWDRTDDAYAKRYQTTMADMRAAGLNPILAAGSGGFNVGQGPIAPMAMPVPSSDATSAYSNLMQGIEAKQRAKTEKVKQLKLMAETHTEIARKYEVRANTGKVSEEERRVWHEIEKLHSETMLNLKTGFRTDAEKRLMEKKINQLAVELTRLKNVNSIYENPASMALSIIRELANSIGLNIGIIGSMRGK